MTGELGDHLLGDDPIDGSHEHPDRLDRGKYAVQLLPLLERVRAQSESSVLAMIGPWGSGKSSVLAMMMRELRQDDTWLVAEFNPWAYSDIESLQLGFFAELRAALPEDGQWRETRKKIGDFSRAVSPLGKIGGLVGVDAESAMQRLSDFLAGDVSANGTKQKAQEALRQLGRPILLVLDDLDRLTPDELLLVMKLVRHVGRLPNLYYLLCYDEQTLLDVLKRTDLVGNEGEARARDYLEKIVQIRLDLPALREHQIMQLMDEGLSKVLERGRVHLGSEAKGRLSKAYTSVLRDRLTTPRAINRFLAQVDAFHSLVDKEVDFVDFLCVTWLRTSEPRLYSLIQRSRSELTGTAWPKAPGRRENHKEQRESWVERLRGAGVAPPHADGVLDLLALLFLPIRSAVEGWTYSGSFSEDLAARQGVGHVDYFDRYFAFGVPAEDVPDSLVSRGLQELHHFSESPNVRALAQALREQPERVMRKLRARRASGEVQEPELLLRLVALEYPNLEPSPGTFLGDPRSDAEYLAFDLLSDIDPPASRALILNSLAKNGYGLRFAAGVARIAKKVAGRVESNVDTPDWIDPVVTVAANSIASEFELVSRRPLNQVNDFEFRLFWYWRRIQPKEASSWLRDQVTSGRWGLLESLVRLVTVGVTRSGGREIVSDFSLGVVDEVFGIERVLDEIGSEIDGAEPVEDHLSLPSTMDNRRAYALWTLRLEKERRASMQPEAEA
ncbi:KAP family NTPase [Micromonospora sp. NBC_01740]|uniref:KAP family P-loop NTPase fold protein n=1 Tax=Micromonospora sp. NBC_01740 TaxID=2975986 RepID=UPI002E0F48CF|nr:KAP family NTPase [Micromonospora sp. NBC_01740]